MNTMLDVPIFLNFVNVVSRGVSERHVGCCNHGATRGFLNATHNERDLSSPNQFHFKLFSFSFLFYFINLDVYLKCAC